MAEAQQSDEEILRFRYKASSLVLRDFPLPTGAGTITCDIYTGHERPFVPATLRRKIFNILHGLSHPGVQATVKLITDRFVWPNINRDVRLWTQSCLPSTSANSFIPPDLDTCKFALVRHDAVSRPLQPPYHGPYKVVQRSNKDFVIHRNVKSDTVSIYRVKRVR
ncbi:unnamed protein product [Dibothriocephalus latus]|uniref:Integrase zinc-binding domain-containing protein n=1 Tax=Dibothriocephalus latus TaxID=60516 RepID=A0A3P7LQF1_DIBLA|nr:unnamed protein product [Dibothriocephalus latus]